MARQREVLAERMADEAVVGEDAPQVRMPLEHDAEKVERLALEPVHPGPHLDALLELHRRVVAQCGAGLQVLPRLHLEGELSEAFRRCQTQLRERIEKPLQLRCHLAIVAFELGFIERSYWFS